MMLDRLMQHGIGVGGGANIKSIQRGDTSMASNNINVAISEVDLTKAIVVIQVGGNVNGEQWRCIKATLTNSTTLNLSSLTANSNIIARWQVIEFDNAKSVQRGNLILDTADEVEVTISEVNTEKSLIFTSYKMNTSTAVYPRDIGGQIKSPTSIGISGGGNSNIDWQVIEFK